MPTLAQSQPLRYGTFFYLYFMQGLPSGLALTALTNYLAAQGLDAQQLAAFGTIIGLPWGVKFMWGPLIDRYQNSAMGQRRPWVILAQSLAFLASLGLLTLPADPAANLTRLTWAFTIHGVFASLQDVSVDALAITVVPPPERGRVNALMKGGLVSGQAFGAAGLALVIHERGFQTAALLQSSLLLILTILTFFIREHRSDAWFSFRLRPKLSHHSSLTSLRAILRELVKALLVRRNLTLFGLIALVFIGERLFQRVFMLHLIWTEGWSDTSVSVLSGTYGTAAALGVALIGGWLSDRVGSQRLLMSIVLLTAGFHIGFSLGHAWWANPAVATSGLVMNQTLEPLFSIAALPVLMGLCRPSIAGAQFAFYMALSNQADLLGIYLSGALYPQLAGWVIGLGIGLVMLVTWRILSQDRRRLKELE